MALSAAACGGDDRPLRLSVSLVEAGAPLGSGGGGGSSGVKNVSDSGDVDYGQFLDSGIKHDIDASAGPCVHTNLDGKPDCDDTLSLNSDFNRSIQGWTGTANATVRWVQLDVQGAGQSGSIAVKNVEEGDYDGVSEAAATQCLSATPGVTYTYEAWTFIEHGQPFGNAQLEVWFYDQPDCAPLVTDNGAYALNSLDVTDHWNLLRGSLKVPATVHSMSVRLVATKPYRNRPIEVLFDSVRVQKLNLDTTTN
jgi:hypothetical protein